MIGFWTRAWDKIRRVFAFWAYALYGASPKWLQKHLQLSNSPKRIELESANDLTLRAPNAGCDLDIVLTDDLVLVHHSRFPKEAAQELGKVIQLEAERVMPVTIDQLHIAYNIEAKNNDGSLDVSLVAARRRVVEQILLSAKRAGLIVRSVTVSAKGSRDIPFRLARVRNLKLKRASTLTAAIALAVILALQIPSAYLGKLEDAIGVTDQKIQIARKNTIKIAGLQRRVDSLQELSGAVMSVKREGQILELLSILTTVSPDAVKIDEMRLDGRRLFLSGRAEAPEEWVISLQQNNAFDDVRLTSVLGQTNEKFRRFEAHANVLWPHERSGK